MKKMWCSYKLTISFLVALVLAIIPAIAYVNLEADKEACFADGSFTVRVWNSKPDQLYTKDIAIELWHHETGNKYVSQGTWSDTLIHFTMYDPDRKFATFVSAPGTLNDSGDYRLTLAYEGCREMKRCMKHVSLERCPGLTYECKTLDFQVTSCVVRGSEVIITVDAPKVLSLSEIRPYKDLNFYLSSNYQDLDGVGKIPGMMIEQPTNKSLRISVPLRKNERIESAAVVAGMCDSPAAITKLAPCQTINIPVVQSAPSSAEGSLEEKKRTAETAPLGEKQKPLPKQEESEEAEALPAKEDIKEDTEPTGKTAQTQTPVVVIPLHVGVFVVVIILGAIILMHYKRAGRKSRDGDEQK